MTEGAVAHARPRGYAKGRARRQQIVQAAVAEFSAVGYRKASLREIAAACDITHPGLLHHFPTKVDLLRAVLAYRDEQDVLRWHLQNSRGKAFLNRLVELISHNEDRRQLVELYVMLSAEATSVDHPAHEYFQQRYLKVRHMIRNAILHGQHSGELRPEINADRAATQLIALIDGLQVQWLSDPERVDMGAVMSDAVGQLVANPPRNRLLQG